MFISCAMLLIETDTLFEMRFLCSQKTTPNLLADLWATEDYLKSFSSDLH